MIVPVLLAGGVGTRLWPLSRRNYPKQFLPLVGGEALLQQALQRIAAIKDATPPLVVGSEPHRFLIAEHLRQAGLGGLIILEPEGRNTAPAAAVAALEAISIYGEDAQLLIMPSDHTISNPEQFASTMAIGSNLVTRGHLVAFGVTPTSPETGYGYIRAGAALAQGGHAIEAFVEKPDLDTATTYLKAGGYYWNSGIFLFAARQYLNSLKEHAPEILQATQAAHQGRKRDADFLRLDAAAFHACPDNSIDYAVMEKVHDAAVVPLNTAWSDLGSWSAVAATGTKDEHNNITQGDVVLEDSDECFVHSDGRLVAVLGMQDTIVVETKDAVLVADRAHEQAVKGLVSQLIIQNRDEAYNHTVVYRPWGSYESIASGERFQVKRIVVRPDASLSLQMHHHRAEHWVVVQGTATVTCDDKTTLLGENQSTYIPLGATHRLANHGKLDLVIIEIQSGSYLGEDDIVRLDDAYGRADSKKPVPLHPKATSA